MGIRSWRSYIKPATTLTSAAVRRFPEIHCGHCWPGFECLLVLSERHKPNKLIKNQNASMINADKLKAKMSETIMSSAPLAFSSEYVGDELGSLSSCRSKYATTMSRTPMNPARSNKWKFMVPPTAIARRCESRVPTLSLQLLPRRSAPPRLWQCQILTRCT
jgi:hypothetical protein